MLKDNLVTDKSLKTKQEGTGNFCCVGEGMAIGKFLKRAGTAMCPVGKGRKRKEYLKKGGGKFLKRAGTAVCPLGMG